MKICALILASNIDEKNCLGYPKGMEIAWLKKCDFELSSWPFVYLCTYFHSWILSSLAEMFEEIGTGCVDWKHLVPHRVQLQALVNRLMNLIFVVPCIMLNSEIIPTRCNNCVYSSQCVELTQHSAFRETARHNKTVLPTTQHDRQR